MANFSIQLSLPCALASVHDHLREVRLALVPECDENVSTLQYESKQESDRNLMIPSKDHFISALCQVPRIVAHLRNVGSFSIDGFDLELEINRLCLEHSTLPRLADIEPTIRQI